MWFAFKIYAETSNMGKKLNNIGCQNQKILDSIQQLKNVGNRKKQWLIELSNTVHGCQTQQILGNETEKYW